MAEEEWRPVVGYEGSYSVSSLGRVRSLSRVVNRSNGVPQRIPQRILSPSPTRDGRVRINLYRLGEGLAGSRRYLVHRLVLEAFVGPCPEGLEALHGNDDPKDNRLSNLRWGTSAENKQDSVRNGRHGMAKKTHCKRGHPLTGENIRPFNGVKSNRRVCRACKLEAGNARSAKRPFDLERSWVRFEQLTNGVSNG